MNYLKQNLTKLINKIVVEEEIDKYTAFVKLAKLSKGFFWDLYDLTDRKYGFNTTYQTTSTELLLDAFLNSVGKLTYEDIERIANGMNEHDHFELMLLFSAEEYQPL